MGDWSIVIFAATLFVAYTNGANDNFKGVATLFGSGTTSYRKALYWATIATFAGSATAFYLATELVSIFQGNGLLPAHLTRSEPFIGALIWASKWGVPVSTTHVSCGALFGIGLANGQARWHVIRTILCAWLLTLPTAAVLSAACYCFFKIF